MLKKIISGGQTGVDRAALDIAIKLNIDCGGWCPKSRIDERDIIPMYYTSLVEIDGEFDNDQDNFNARTIRNILDSDGTLIIVPCWPLPSDLKDGTILTLTKLKEQTKAYHVLNIENPDVTDCINWMIETSIETLNIAGPRESSCPGIRALTTSLLEELLSSYQ
ncbi:MAG: putative molybdenum carrier protein [Gammaproteobacteria bacterium]|nr:putative molybdenum carrier protein [Gammaproteobacteria bacterium]